MNCRKTILIGVLLLISVLNACATNNSDKKQKSETTDNNVMTTDTVTMSEKPVSTTVVNTPSPTYKPYVMGFAGDINFNDNYQNMQYLKNSKRGLKDCISEELLNKMKSADVMMLNNEFAFSERGTPAEGKEYTFRSRPENVSLLKEMGVDIVSLANNHALDYGRDALKDTFTVLDDAGIAYVGAGADAERAAEVVTFDNQGMKIGCIAASRVIYQNDWVAGNSNSGMQSAYDLAYMLDEINKASKECDFLIVYVHWGVEYNKYPEDYQREWARQYIDSGADAVIGCHPHVIQGLEIYNGHPIIYSMGNFWFNSAEKYSMYAELTINEDNSSSVCVYPCYNKRCQTFLIDDPKGISAYYNELTALSYNIVIDKEGNTTAAGAPSN